MKKLSLLLAGFLVAGSAVAVADSSAYACGLHPLARMSRTVQEGSGIVPVLERFDAYADRNGAHGEPVVASWMPTRSPGANGSAGPIVFIQEMWFDDPVQLTVWFDEEGELVGKSFVCR